jgi:hypothetical protein
VQNSKRSTGDHGSSLYLDSVVATESIVNNKPLLYCDLVHSSKNLGTFLTSVAALPVQSQNKLLNEKIILLHDKLANTMEELEHINAFHKQMEKVLHQVDD